MIKPITAQSTFFKYVVACLVPVAALMLTQLTWPIVNNSPFLYFFGAVAISAWYGGVLPGLVSATLAVFLADYFLIDPLYSIFTNLADILQLIIFSLIAFLISWLEVRRDRSQQSFLEVSKQLAVILNGVVDGITAHDADGHIVFANQSAAELAGYESPEAMIAIPATEARNKFKIYDEKGKLLPYSSLQNHSVFKRGERTTLTLRMQAVDTNETKWIQLTTAPVHGENGDVRLVVNILRDITQQVQIERERPRFAAIVHNSNDAIIGQSLDGEITSWNPGAETIYGYSTKDVIGKHISIIFPEDIKSQENQLLDSVKNGEKIEHYETRRVHRDGSERQISLTISPIRTGIGHLVGYSTIERDISKSKQREQEVIKLTSMIELQRRRLNAIVRNVPGIIYDMTVDFDTKEQKVNFISEDVENMLGYTPDEWTSNPNLWAEIADADDWKRAQVEIADAYESDRRGQIQLKCQTVGGDEVIVESLFNFVKMNSEVRQFGVIMDITQRKLIEEALNDYMEELRRSNEELEQFAYVASHDLQEPLRMITSYLQLIEQRFSDHIDDDLHVFINFAVDGATRMKALINDLLAYSRIQRSASELAPVNMEDVLSQVQRNLQIPIEESQAKITSDELPASIMGNEAQMIQLLQNLMNNALKYRGDNPPHIHVGASRRGQHWEFSVCDNGIGIAPEHHGRIFDLFQRLHTRQEYSGTGIGLAICRKIVTKHDGNIWVESQPGEGTTFFFTIPITTRRRVYFHENR